ncbi:raffinose/stachyose/melibiose transport system permease [Enterococcus sp. AZ188]|uniref:carbohydrate ABC transporter permease n=1 Tax=unclassified Enterococcus TaxID=2608891 RepID=UPI003D2FDF4B
MKQNDWIVCIKFLVLSLVSFIVLVPIYYLIVTTFKSAPEAAANPMSLPQSWSLSPYIEAFQKMNYLNAFKNTLIITSLSVIGLVVVSSMAGYVLNRMSQKKIYSRIFLIILAGMMFPYQMSIMGLYKIVQNLNLMNTLLAVILINIAVNIPFATLMFHSFADTIPTELEESARMDGATFFQIFRKVIFPLLKPTTMTIAILNTLTIWNDFMGPLYFLQSREQNVILQEVNRNIGQFSTDWSSMFPMMVLGILPLLIFYLIMQRYIIGGVMSGAVKG